MKFPHNNSRVEALSDAIFAFAATLLVVSVGYEESASVLKIDWVAFTSFAISFFVLLALWYVHYNFFRRNRYVDNLIIAINAVLLFVVLYYIFPLKSLIATWTGKQGLSIEDFSSLFQLYSLGFLLIFMCFSLMYYRAYVKAKTPTANIDLLFYARHFSIYIAVAALSILISRLHLGLKIALPGIIYTLLGPFCYVHAVRFKKKYRIPQDD